MGWYLWTVLLLHVVVSVQCFLHRRPRSQLPPRDGGDPGKPLFLSPYIESGYISEAQRLARVNITEELHIKSYAGFFTVNKTYDSNQFFWYFPAIDQNNTEAPVIVWLQGGPGNSALYGLFFENGPIYVINGHFKRRIYNWALRHHVIYIDNPVGTGFSFTNDSRGYCTDQTQIGEHLYSTITQFFQLFPELQQNKLFVAGKSYGGKFATALSNMIHKKNPTAEVKINLKGIAILGGFVDPEHQLMHSDYLYQIGLLDWNQARVSKEIKNNITKYIRQRQWDDAAKVYYNNYIIFIANQTGFNFGYNILQTDNYLFKYEDIDLMLQKTFVRRAIHVGELPYNDGFRSNMVFSKLVTDTLQSVAPWISELLNYYNVLIYNGQLDIIGAYPNIVNYLRKLKFAGSEEYKTAKRYIWRVGGEVAGYTKRAGKLLEVMVRNAGHSVPADQPEWALDLITSFTYNLPMDEVYYIEGTLRRRNASIKVFTNASNELSTNASSKESTMAANSQ